MLITLFRRTISCQSVAEVYMTSLAPLGAVSQRFFEVKTSVDALYKNVVGFELD